MIISAIKNKRKKNKNKDVKFVLMNTTGPPIIVLFLDKMKPPNYIVDLGGKDTQRIHLIFS